MRHRQSQRGFRWGTLFLILFTLLIAGGGTFGALVAAGYISFGPTEPSHEGEIKFPAAAMPIPAFTQVTQEHLINPQTKELHFVWVKQEQVSETMLRDLRDILGRVTSRNKTPGLIFTENDVMPKGTRPGFSAGVPPGKRAMTLKASQIPGLEELRRGDTFDLLAALPVRKEGENDSNVEYGVLLGGIKPPDTRAGRLQRQSGVKVLVRGGVMVAHRKGKEQSTEGGSALVVTPPGSRRTPELSIDATIAVDPAEVMPLTEALGLEVSIYCVAHSGHPDSLATDSFPDFDLTGLVAVPATVRPVKAFSRITQADLADPITGKLNVYYFSPARVSPEWLTEFRDLAGRVVSRDVEAGFIFSQTDLMPPGTPAGLAAAVPVGKVALAVAKGRIKGLEDLRQGDRFDVLSTLPQGMGAQLPPILDWAALMGGRPRPEDAAIHEQLRTGLRILTRDALKLMDDDEEDKTAIAVNPEEVTPLSQMLNREEIHLQVIVHPGRQPDQPAKLPSNMVQVGSDHPEMKELGFISLKEVNPAAEVDVQAPAKADASSEVEVPVTVRPIQAFKQLTLEDFQDPSTGQIRYLQFPKDRVQNTWETDVTKLINRVAGKNILPGRVVQTGDLLPSGTKPGPTAGIPPGRRGISFTSEQLDGLGSFQEGDKIDVVVAFPFDDAQVEAKAPWLAEMQRSLRLVPNLNEFTKQADTHSVAQDVLLVTLAQEKLEQVVEVTEETVTEEIVVGNTIKRIGVQKTPAVRIVERNLTVATLALEPAETAIITELLATGAKLYVAARSGQPSGSPGDASPGKPLAKAQPKKRDEATREQPATAESSGIPPNAAFDQMAHQWQEAESIYREQQQTRWNQYLNALKNTHGIEEIRGPSRQTRYWLNGRPANDLPTPPADLLSRQSPNSPIDN
jgi:hypothetical protein